MTNEMTIKQLADELGVSKTAINKKVTENFKRKHFKKIGNRFVIDKAGQDIIKSMFNCDSDGKRKPEVGDTENFANSKVGDNSDLVSVLKERLTISDEQNNKKDIQIEKLQKLLDQQQILTLQANKKIEELELKKNQEEEEKTEQTNFSEEKKETTEEVKKKSSFFSRFFGK